MELSALECYGYGRTCIIMQFLGDEKIENVMFLCFGKVGETIRWIVCDAENVWRG